MPDADPIELVFGGLDKLGPSSNTTTLDAIRALPISRFDTIVDAGCGTGQQTLILVKELRQLVHAVDNNEGFLRDLRKRADAADLGQFVSTHHLDLSEIADAFPMIDLLWSEGAAYNIGFANALESWSKSITSGFAAVSELCWLHEKIPDSVRQFFTEGYPEMKSIDKNRLIAEDAGFRIIKTRVLSDECWTNGYYDILEPRANSLLSHADAKVRAFAESTIEEIDIHRQSNGCYGYVLLTLKRLT